MINDLAPDIALRELLSGYWKTAVINALASLDIADVMAEAHCEASVIAAKLNLDPVGVRRLMLAGASLGVLVHEGGDRFDLTPMGQLLRADTPGSLKAMAMHQGGDIYRAFGELAQTIRTGLPPDWIRSGADGFADLNDNPEAAAVFNRAMADGSVIVAERACDAFDFGRYARVADIGGGYGAVLAVILNRYPDLSGAVVDLDHSAEGARNYLESQGVLNRSDFVVGSFFDELDIDADCYLLKYIIHDWPDNEALAILTRCAEAAAANDAEVVLIERLVPAQVELSLTHQNVVKADLTMLLWNGQERTLIEYEALLARAGLQIQDVVNMPDEFALMIARPISR